jgi:ribosome maturation factor RimP
LLKKTITYKEDKFLIEEKSSLLDQKLQELLAPVITALGYELWGIERLSQGVGGLVRIYIDSHQGISIDDCERVSYQVSGILDVHDPIPGHYTLEVSSPGLDRPLFTLEQFARFLGHQAQVRLLQPLNAQRNFTGEIQRIEKTQVILKIADTEYILPIEQIEKARLVPKSEELKIKK